MKTPWLEGTGDNSVTNDGATWNTRNGVNPWVGGAISTADYFSTSLGSMNAGGANDSSVAVTVTSVVSNWLNAGVPNYGFIVSGTSGTQTGVFYARETLVTRPSRRPSW